MDASQSISNESAYTGYNHFTVGQEISFFVTYMISVGLSLFGSSMILFLVIKTKKWKTEVQHRLVAGLSIMDLIVSTSIGLMIFLAPQDIGRFFARGTTRTCEVTGFFFQFYAGGAFYNACLSLFYCLMITYSWKEDRIKKWMEPWVHLFAFGFPLAFGIAALQQKLLNPDPMHGVCSTHLYPAECKYNDDVECERGSKDSILLPILRCFYLLTVFAGILFTVKVYCSVRKQTRQSLKYSVDGKLTPTQKRRIRAVGFQAMLYTAAFLNGFVVVTLDSVMEGVFFSDSESHRGKMNHKNGIFPTVLIIYLLFPLQGFLNFLVYIQPRLRQWRRANPERTVFWAFRMVLTGNPPTTMMKATCHSSGNLGSSKSFGYDPAIEDLPEANQANRDDTNQREVFHQEEEDEEEEDERHQRQEHDDEDPHEEETIGTM